MTVAAISGVGATPLAHGGIVGAIAEASVAIVVTGIFVAVWLRERSARKHAAENDVRDSVD
jgi:hypothetical protein